MPGAEFGSSWEGRGLAFLDGGETPSRRVQRLDEGYIVVVDYCYSHLARFHSAVYAGYHMAGYLSE